MECGGLPPLQVARWLALGAGHSGSKLPRNALSPHARTL